MEMLLVAPLVILGMQLARVSGQTKPKQTPPTLSVREGESPALLCSSFDKTTSSLQWYQQDFGKHPVFLFQMALNKDEKQNGRLTATINKENQTSWLHIRDAQPRDSATYGNQVIFGKGTSLTVKPNVTNPQPRMYRLKKPQVNDLSICLFTDFGNDEVNMTGIRNIMRAPSVVDVKRLESKSLGIVAWDNSLDWDCQAQASEAVYSLSNSSGKVCNAKVVTENFSSDPYLNSRNLAMIFLRVVFVKTMGFNLLMTLKLWSS